MTKKFYWTKEEIDFVKISINKKLPSVIREFNKKFTPRTQGAIKIVYYQLRRENVSSVKTKETTSRTHTRMGFTPEQLSVLSQDKPEIDIAVEYAAKFPTDKILSLNTFKTWVVNANRMKATEIANKKKELTQKIEDVANKQLASKVIKPSSSFVDEDAMIVKNHNLMAEQIQLLKELIVAVNTIVPNFVSAIESSKKKE